MTIYRCDKCKKEFTDIAAIYRIRMMTETCEYDDGTPVWYPHRKTIHYEVCNECAKNIMQTFVDQLKEEGEENVLVRQPVEEAADENSQSVF